MVKRQRCNSASSCQPECTKSLKQLIRTTAGQRSYYVVFELKLEDSKGSCLLPVEANPEGRSSPTSLLDLLGAARDYYRLSLFPRASGGRREDSQWPRGLGLPYQNQMRG